MLESSDPSATRPAWGQEVTVKMQCVLEDRTVVEKDSKLVFVIGDGDVNQVKSVESLCFLVWVIVCCSESVFVSSYGDRCRLGKLLTENDKTHD